jgi:hypothetical protein
MEVGAEAGQRPGRDARGMSTLNLDDETALDLAFGAFPAHESVELAEREVDGISIALYWLRGSDVLAVTVDDATTSSTIPSHSHTHAASSCSVTGTSPGSPSTSSRARERTCRR